MLGMISSFLEEEFGVLTASWIELELGVVIM
jgi:hypothetical protein